MRCDSGNCQVDVAATDVVSRVLKIHEKSGEVRRQDLELHAPIHE
jgi:hypothetical protein